MAENYFFFVKKEFSKLKNLTQINQAHNSQFQILKTVLAAVETLAKVGFNQVEQLYLPGLIRGIKSSM